MLPPADKLYGDANFIFQQDLTPVHRGITPIQSEVARADFWAKWILNVASKNKIAE